MYQALLSHKLLIRRYPIAIQKTSLTISHEGREEHYGCEKAEKDSVACAAMLTGQES